MIKIIFFFAYSYHVGGCDTCISIIILKIDIVLLNVRVGALSIFIRVKNIDQHVELLPYIIWDHVGDRKFVKNVIFFAKCVSTSIFLNPKDLKVSV